jgi:23S rRNA (cytosine1962-C5)-methyltransferase
MSQAEEKYLMFRNRLEKVYRHLSRMAKKQNVSCFRFYDHDIPEFPFIIEMYESRLYVSEYKRHHSMDEEMHAEWWIKCAEILTAVTNVQPDEIYLKSRQRKESRKGQYQKLDEKKNEFVVKENGHSFIINLSDYLDTGLFLDHRITRKMVQEMVKEKDFLNLFCYTGSFSVYALAGGARHVESVDLSKTYLEWTARNVALNFHEPGDHKLVHADVKQFLKRNEKKYHVIVMDPPTFSNSKRMGDDFLDIQRDHVELINDCINSLYDHGILIFSTNFSKFKLEESRIKASAIKDITKATTPFDFAGKLNRFCFRITK